MANVRKGPGREALEAYRVNRAGIERLWQPIYDFQTYATTGGTEFNFFQTPVGQSGKTFADTNMELAGQLPAGKTMLVTGVRVYFTPNVNLEGLAANTYLDDMRTVRFAGWLEFEIGSKNYLRQAPLAEFPSMQSIEGFAATNITSGTDGSLIEYGDVRGKYYAIDPIRLESTQNFKVSIKFASAITTTNTARIGVELDGWLFRNSQ